MEKRRWLQMALQLKGSVIPSVFPRTLLCGFFGVFISILFYFGLPVAQPIFANVIPSIVLGLLLVFRTNTAYERFWEGRKCWGHLVNTVRNLARQIWIGVVEQSPQERTNKIAALRLLVAFAVATKLHLRQEPVSSELEPLVQRSQYFKLQEMNHPPLEIAFWIGDYLQEQYSRDRVNPYQLSGMLHLLDEMVNALGGCERILKTPMPMAYAIHLKQLLLIYCLLLPFPLVAEIAWFTGPVVALVSFTLFGIEEIGIEIENPFGRDPNDLPLDAICSTMLRNIEDLITLAPCTRSYSDSSAIAPLESPTS
ncbi:bestrophin family protein [Trichocoleus sp. FACHB-262]|uniref:bestrophin family protein n=1 Tax=Trichocoleus sp. FACHB-262 TaxID=2692869 RepID=UPI002410C9B0|nr:bestrophin family ion channel [Trichocoleus sp. FACHB-262]